MTAPWGCQGQLRRRGTVFEVSMDEPVSAIMLALVLRQIMPSLAIAQVDDMVSAHVTQSVDKATTFRSFLDWLFSEEQLKSMRPAPKAQGWEARELGRPGGAEGESGLARAWGDAGRGPEELGTAAGRPWKPRILVGRTF